MSRVTLKVFILFFIVVGIYTYYANSIPQIESQPPEELTLEEGKMSPEVLVELGKKTFYGKGACAVCHGMGEKGQRAPDLEGVGARASRRVEGLGASQYLIQSLIEPETYVVEGYENIMPPANKPPVSLNEMELLAVVAFLQSLGGAVTITREDLPPEVRAEAAKPERMAAPPVVAGDPGKGKEIFEKQQCIACHKVGDEGGQLGPDLSTIARKGDEYLRTSILDPAADLVPGFQPVMPPDYAEKLTVKEFNDLMAYLLTLRGE